jgi:alkylation response protein AidB-like acyl-CoA dehydrogenase
MISFGLSEDQEILRDTVRKFAAEELRPKMREWEKARAVPEGVRKKFSELGLELIDVPENLGGQGMGSLAAAVVHEELAYGDPGAAIALWGPGSAAAAILELGDDEQRKRWLGALGNGKRGAVAYSEKWKVPASGFATTAQAYGEGWLLTGAKSFVIGGGQADLTVVFAQVEGKGWDGVGAFVVDGTPDGMKQGARHDLIGVETIHAAELVFEACKVPRQNRLVGGGDFGKAARRFFARMALTNAARQVGLARASYEFALEYTQDRHAFGKPVAHFQSIAFTLAEMAMDVDAARCMLWKAASDFDANTPGALAQVARAAVQANTAAWRVADDGVQLLGGAGFVQDYPAEKWERDTKALALLAPSSELQTLAVAAEILGRPDDFGPALPSSDIQPIFT